MTVGATDAPKIQELSTVVLCLAVEHVARCAEHGTKQRIGADDRRAHRPCSTAKQRLFTRTVATGRKPCAGRKCQE